MLVSLASSPVLGQPTDCIDVIHGQVAWPITGWLLLRAGDKQDGSCFNECGTMLINIIYSDINRHHNVIDLGPRACRADFMSSNTLECCQKCNIWMNSDSPPFLPDGF